MQPARRSTSSFNPFPSPSLRPSSSSDDSLRRSSFSVSIRFQNLTPHSCSISNLLEYTYILEEVVDIEASSSDTLPFAQSMAIIPIYSEVDIFVSQFYLDGKKIYVDKINGHFIWDIAPERCDPDCSYDEYYDDDDYVPRRRRTKSRCKPKPTSPQRRYHLDGPDSPWILHLKNSLPPSRLDIHQLIRKSCKSKPVHSPAPTQPVSCMMFRSQNSYDEDFSTFPKAPAATCPFVLKVHTYHDL